MSKHSFFAVIVADMRRFQEDGSGWRGIIRGILSQGFQAIFVYRLFRWCYEHHIPTQPVRFIVERFTEITTGISIPAMAQIGKGLRIHHFGGIIIHSDTKMGDYCTLYQGVTLGDLGGWGGAPCIGHHVLLGAGAKVLGQVEVGDYCRVGANAVVLISIPSGCVAVGIPAVIKGKAHNADAP